jgi:hypothetical protein
MPSTGGAWRGDLVFITTTCRPPEEHGEENHSTRLRHIHAVHRRSMARRLTRLGFETTTCRPPEEHGEENHSTRLYKNYFILMFWDHLSIWDTLRLLGTPSPIKGPLMIAVWGLALEVSALFSFLGRKRVYTEGPQNSPSGPVHSETS